MHMNPMDGVDICLTWIIRDWEMKSTRLWELLQQVQGAPGQAHLVGCLKFAPKVCA